MDERLFANATYLTDMDRRKALSDVGFEEEEEVSHGGFQCISGEVLIDPLFGPGKRYSDLSIVEHDHETYAISGLPFVSRLFVYTIWGNKETREVAGRQIFKAKRVSWKPIKMTKSAVIILIKELLNVDTKKGVDTFFSQGKWIQDPKYRDSSDESEYVFPLDHISSRIFSFTKKSTALKEDIWRLLVAHEDFAFLCQGTDTYTAIYPLKMVLRMKHVDISKMIVNLKLRPLEYAFDATVSFFLSIKDFFHFFY